VFCEWEALLADATLRMMMGYASPLYTPAFPAGGTRAVSLAVAQQQLFDGQAYLLWHSPTRNKVRVSRWLYQSPVETVMDTAQAWLEQVAAIRHHVAHRSPDSRQKLDAATMSLAGVRVRGGNAGEFLRANAPAGVHWLDQLVTDMEGLALQLAP
jgi:hypothetical protein